MKEQAALLVGFNGDGRGWNRLEYAELDPAVMRNSLEGLGYWIPDVAVLTGTGATLKGLKSALKCLSLESPRRLLFYFAGHGGLVDGVIGLAFCESTPLKLYDIESEIRRRCSTVQQFICLLDACREPVVLGARGVGTAGFSQSAIANLELRLGGGTSDQRGRGQTAERSGWPHGAVIVLGCEANKCCYEADGSGVFTGKLVEAFDSCAADDPIRASDLVSRVSRSLADVRTTPVQKALVKGDSRIGIRSFGPFADSPTPPPEDHAVGQAVEQILFAGSTGVCLTVNGLCEIRYGRSRWRSADLGGSVDSMALSTDGRVLFTIRTDSRRSWLSQWRIGSQGPELEKEREALAPMGRLALSPDGHWLGALWRPPTANSLLEVFDCDDWSHPECTAPIKHPQNLAWLGNEALLVGSADEVHQWYLFEDADSSYSLNEAGPPEQMIVSRDRKAAAWTGWGGNMWVLSVGSGQAPLNVHMDVPITALTFATDSKTLAIGTANGRVLVYCDRGKDLLQETVYTTEGVVTALAFSHSMGRILVGTSRGEVATIRMQGLGSDSAAEHDV